MVRFEQVGQRAGAVVENVSTASARARLVIKVLARARIAAAVGLIDAKGTDDERKAYKQFVLTVAEAAASANREGGFIGIGGKPVSANEQAALDEISAALHNET